MLIKAPLGNIDPHPVEISHLSCRPPNPLRHKRDYGSNIACFSFVNSSDENRLWDIRADSPTEKHRYLMTTIPIIRPHQKAPQGTIPGGAFQHIYFFLFFAGLPFCAGTGCSSFSEVFCTGASPFSLSEASSSIRIRSPSRFHSLQWRLKRSASR